MAKKVLNVFKIQLQAGKATPAPPVGSTLGPTGINIMNVCKEYNEKTKDKVGMVIPAEITVYEDRSYSLVIKTPPTSELLKKAVKVDKGSGKPNKEKVAKITKAQLKEVAEAKMADLNSSTIEAAMSVVAGTARSMGIVVID